MSDRVRESYVTENKPIWIVWNGSEWDRRETADDGVILFDAILSEIRDEAQADGEWGDDAETAPELWIAYPLAMHLVPDVDEDGAEVSRSHVTEYPDPIATLTAERDAANAERDAVRAELAMLSAARDADRAMLGRIVGCEQSDASMVVLLERAEAVIAGLRAELAREKQRRDDDARAMHNRLVAAYAERPDSL